MSGPRGAGMAGNSNRLAMALRSAADGFAATTSSIAAMRPRSQTVRLVAEIGPFGFFRSRREI